MGFLAAHNENLKFGNRIFICVLCSVSALRKVKHKHHSHLCLIFGWCQKGVNHSSGVGFFVCGLGLFLFGSVLCVEVFLVCGFL